MGRGDDSACSSWLGGGQQISKLESDNDRLRRDNDRLRAQVKRLRSQVQALGGQVARQVSELLASTGD